MTTSDDVHHKLSVVSAQLGLERSKHDRLKLDYDNLLDDYRIVTQRARDLQRSIDQLKERISQLERTRHA